MKIKKVVSVVLAAAMLSGAAAFCGASAQSSAPAPRIVETVYPSTDVIVADIVLTEAPYSADLTGGRDCAPVLQRAIDDLYEAGGGTVYLPAGEYRLCSGINIRPFVTVHGDWQDPDEGNEYGTVIIADVESTESSAPALFTVGGSAGAVGLTVWYPEQTLDEVKPYPYTFYIDGLGANYMLHSIINCTLLNSYRGIGACVEDGEGVNNAHEMTTVERVKGTCLSEGLTSFNSADVDTVKTLYFSGKYWSEAGSRFNGPSLEKLNAYTKQNLTAFTLGDLEWPEFCDIRAESCLYGIHFRKGPRASFSGTFFDMSLTDCRTGIYADRGSIMERKRQWGYSVANSTIEADCAAIRDFTGGVVMLTNVSISGLVLGRNIHRETASTERYGLDYNFGYVQPAHNLYIAEADRTGKTDASSAVQSRLDEAAETGGIVYLPAGVYRFDGPVTVPSGVELRGSGTVATRCQSGCSKGTLILSYYGYEEGDRPLITVEGENSGVYAIRINHLENSIKDDSGSFTPTSPAVYVSGKNNHAINCFAILSSVGFELDGCENAYIRRCVGCCIDSFIRIKDSKDVLIEGCLQNANTLPRNGYAGLGIPELENWIQEKDLFTYAFIPVFRIYTDYLSVYGSSGVTVFNTFIYGGRRFLYEENSEIFVCGVGSDGQSDKYNAYTLKGGEITVIGTMHSSGYGYTPMPTYEVSDGAKLKMYDRISVDDRFNMFTRFENITCGELECRDYFLYLMQPLIRLCELLGLKISG